MTEASHAIIPAAQIGTWARSLRDIAIRILPPAGLARADQVLTGLDDDASATEVLETAHSLPRGSAEYHELRLVADSIAQYGTLAGTGKRDAV